MNKPRPIKTYEELLDAIGHTHLACHKLCKQLLGYYLPVSGNIGIFCHYDDEYEFLTTLRKELTRENDNWNHKYFRLHQPIHIEAEDDIPAATYTYLYIRKPDETHPQVGDVDFYMPTDEFTTLKQSLKNKPQQGMRTMEHRPDLDLIELADPAIDALAYVGDHTM